MAMDDSQLDTATAEAKAELAREALAIFTKYRPASRSVDMVKELLHQYLMPMAQVFTVVVRSKREIDGDLLVQLVQLGAEQWDEALDEMTVTAVSATGDEMPAHPTDTVILNRLKQKATTIFEEVDEEDIDREDAYDQFYKLFKEIS